MHMSVKKLEHVLLNGLSVIMIVVIKHCTSLNNLAQMYNHLIIIMNPDFHGGI